MVSSGPDHARWTCNQLDTIHRAGRQAQPTTGAIHRQHTVYLFFSTDDGIYRACVQTSLARDTLCFVDMGDVLHSLGKGKILRHAACHACQCLQGDFAAGAAAVDIGMLRGDSLCIRAAPRETTFATLCLWEVGIDVLSQTSQCLAVVVGFHAMVM